MKSTIAEYGRDSESNNMDRNTDYHKIGQSKSNALGKKSEMHIFEREGEAASRGEDPGNFYEKLVLFKPLKMWREVVRGRGSDRRNRTKSQGKKGMGVRGD